MSLTQENNSDEPLCNSSANGKEYYIPVEQMGGVVGNAVSIPFLISSISTTSCIAIIFGAIALGIKYGSKEKKTSGGVITLVIFFFICLLSMIGSIVKMILNIKDIKNSGQRPCYSEKEKKVIE
jgi:hypothetical protein